MKFSKVPVGSRFHFKTGQHVYVKLEKRQYVREFGKPTIRTMADDGDVVVMPTCEACKLL